MISQGKNTPLSVILIGLFAVITTTAQNSSETSTSATIDDSTPLQISKDTLELISYIVGWIYFAAWSISFYPQIIQNFQRKR